MNAANIKTDDIVWCNVRGQRFYAAVDQEVRQYENLGKRAVRVRSLDTRPIPTHYVTPRQIEGHWRKSAATRRNDVPKQ